MKCIFCILWLVWAGVSCSNDELNYYKDLWKKSMAKALEWTRPTSNSEFQYVDRSYCEESGRYDFIIVGGGSSGAVLANRLSENPETTVLLLEAGGDETDFSLIPSVFNANINSDHNWGYLTTKQKYACFGMKNNQCDFSRGKLLGGCSAINAMMHVRGNKHDYNHWAAIGNPGWSYDDVLPYFIKSENATDVEPDRNYQGTSGPLHIAYAEPTPQFTNLVIAGNMELGLKYTNYNAEDQIGVSRMQTNLLNGRRHSTNQAYLKQIRHRKNLTILTKSLAVKINFIRRRATGVTFLHNGICKRVSTKKEVILSAGAVNSPQLLMLSGIGPKEDLKKHNIKPRADLPVGRNLEDHTCVFGIGFKNNHTIPTPTLDEQLKDFINGTGLLTYTDGLELSFHHINNAVDKGPDIEVLYFYNGQTFDKFPFTKKQNNYIHEIAEALRSPSRGIIMQHFILLHPKSRGYITLKSKDPIDFPLINPRYLSHPEDIETLYLGIRNNLRLLNTEAFRKINATLLDIPLPACKGLKGRAFWYCVIRYKAAGIYHPIGTCRMGGDTVDSVVDHNLKVHGFSNLRVVDASVIPASTSGHLNSVAVMIAEKISDRIKMDHNI